MVQKEAVERFAFVFLFVLCCAAPLPLSQSTSAAPLLAHRTCSSPTRTHLNLHRHTLHFSGQRHLHLNLTQLHSAVLESAFMPASMPELAQEWKQAPVQPAASTSPAAGNQPVVCPSRFEQDDGDDDDDEPVIAVSRSHLLSCAFTSWWPLVKRHTINSRVIALPDEFVAWMQEDGMKLPERLAPARASRDELDDSDSEWSDEEEEGETTGECENDSGVSADPSSFFPALVSALDAAIEALGGCVHPRLDWASPSDASWITCDKTTRCHSAADVVLLLKASDAVAQELSSPFAHCTPDDDDTAGAARQHRPSVVLRRWSNLYPSSRFRCFVWWHRLLAVSQHDANHYAHLTSPTHRQRTTAAIRQFIDEQLAERVTAEGEGRVLDVYVDGEERVWLVDVKPWSTRTDPALFSWRELLDMAAEEDEAAEDEREEEGGSGGEGEEQCEYRVVESGGDNTYMLRVARRQLRRLPSVDGIDLSDAAGIERFTAAMDKLQ